MTQRGQWYDFTTPTGPCIVGGTRYGATGCCGRPKTHVVKWHEPGQITLHSRGGMSVYLGDTGGRLRHHTCAQHATRIVEAQRRRGVDVRAYRYRSGR